MNFSYYVIKRDEELSLNERIQIKKEINELSNAINVFTQHKIPIPTQADVYLSKMKKTISKNNTLIENNRDKIFNANEFFVNDISKAFGYRKERVKDIIAFIEKENPNLKENIKEYFETVYNKISEYSSLFK